MVEDDAEFHFVIYTPPSLFDAAVIARTIYAGLGVKRNWRIHIVGVGSRIPIKLLLESRIPIGLALERIRTKEPHIVSGEDVYIVDSRGRPAWEFGREPRVLVVDYSGVYASQLEDKRAVRVRGLGLQSITYEAISVIYEFFIRRMYGKRGVKHITGDIRSAVYLARKLVEIMSNFDNYVLVEPNAVVYVLRRVYLSEGILLDPAKYSITVDPVAGSVSQVIEMNAYTRRLRPLGKVYARLEDEVFSVEDWRGVRYRFYIDKARRAVCVTPDYCVSTGTMKSELPPSIL
ncbi:hypothetical protein [Hyperthermus butylicus]|uniref:Uncharacterized protein n=1 Tax=Hyperthermus butylicus (strain DSM 5456 / JCM 9403 / PLM1-5) TaxID=415426 RepID=A2BL60_HYPBU|nr:hypothetical protein [Hyperthermus butylicus]ABM80720.1 hypothetical protein Hbut_0869 [Hyperthermus butylicus DSM 5456]